MEEAGNALVITHTREVQTQQIVTENIEILQSLNLSLQVQLSNLQTENNKLKKEMECIKARETVNDLLSADLALIRGQFDKTATALLNKCQENSNLKKEIAALKAGGQPVVAPIVRKRLITVPSPLRARLTLTRRNSDVSSDGTSDVGSYSGKGRPSMGSCGNIVSQIASEEVMPARTNPMALLRNRVLMKLHLRSASTESLESAGRKSFRPEPAPKPTNSVRAPARKPTARPTPSTSVQAMRSAPNSIVKPQPPPRNYRPALGPANSNGQRVIKVSNVTALKRSNSSSSNKSTSSTRPAFRF